MLKHADAQRTSAGSLEELAAICLHLLSSSLIIYQKARLVMQHSLEPAECYCEQYVSVYPVELEDLLKPKTSQDSKSHFSHTFFIVTEFQVT